MSAPVPPEPDARLGETEVAELPPHETVHAPVTIAQVQPRLFGVTPPMLLLALAVGALSAAVVLFAVGNWAVALILVGVGVLLFLAFAEVARRKPDTVVTRGSVAAFDAVRARAGFAAEALAVRSYAGRELLGLRREQAALAQEGHGALYGLGVAVYQGDTTAAEAIRARLDELDRRGHELAERIHEVAVGAQARVQKAQLQVQPTEMMEIQEPYPPPDEGTPPIPAPIPEPYPPPDEGTPPVPEPVPEPGPGMPPPDQG